MTHEGYVTTDDGIRLFFRRAGDGPKLLIIPNGVPLLEAFSYLATTHSVVVFDPRNRGQSDGVTDESKLERGVHHDVDDIEAVRRHFGADTVDLLGHSYLGLVVVLYAMKYPDRVRRLIQIGSVPPDGARTYTREAGDERLVNDVLAGIEQLRTNPPTDAEELCRRFWTILRPLYVVDPRDVGKLPAWERCHLANERTAGAHVFGRIMPSLQRITLTARERAGVSMPVLTIHGERDRSAPHEGAREWVRVLPNARLLRVPGAGHVPWIEAPREVFGEVGAFLSAQ